MYFFSSSPYLPSVESNATKCYCHKNKKFSQDDKFSITEYRLFLTSSVKYLCHLSVLWCCWLGGRKGIRPVKNWVVVCWCGYLSGTRCRLAYGPANATHCLMLQWIGFTFMVLAHRGNSGKRAVKYVCMCVILSPLRINVWAVLFFFHHVTSHRQPTAPGNWYQC